MTVEPLAGTVRLHIRPAQDETGARVCNVEVRDLGGGAVYAGALLVVAGWLKRNGYTYVTGTNGVWAR
jgi:hypothetical protein